MRDRDESLAVGEIRQILRLVNQLHELPAGGERRRRRVVEGLCGLLKADVGESAIFAMTRAGLSMMPSVRVETGRRRGRGRVATPSDGLALNDPAVQRLMGMLDGVRASGLVTRTRRELVARSARKDGTVVDDAVYSARRLERGVAAVLRLSRRPGAGPPMGGRECRIVHLLHSETGWVYDGPIGTTSGILTPRQEECLRHLLAGRSEKQIAEDMKVSPHTVHVYVKAVYRGLGTSTRAELMARFVGKG